MSRALITGASSGIGAAFARRLYTAGYDLVLVGRDTQALNKIIEHAEGKQSQPGDMETLEADLSTEHGTSTVDSRLRSDIGPIDLVVHAAGLTASLPFDVS